MDDVRGSRRIEVPEGVEFVLPTADVGERIGAWLLDVCAIGVIWIGLMIVIDSIPGAGGDVAGGVLGPVVSLVVVLGYHPLCEQAFGGQSPGKRAIGLRVLMLDGGMVSARASAIRSISWLLEGIATLGIPALITSAVSARGARIGDLAAGTMVVNDGPSAVPAAPRIHTRDSGWSIR